MSIMHATGNEVPKREQSTIRASALYDITDDSDLLLSYQYDDLSILGDTFQPDNDATGFLGRMDPDADIGIDQHKNSWTSYTASGDPEDDQDSQRAVVQYQHVLGEYQFTSLTGWTWYDNKRFVDADFLAVDYLNTAYDSGNEQYSQEFRLASPADARIEYVAGTLCPRRQSELLRHHRPALSTNTGVQPLRPPTGWRQPTQL